MRRTPALVLTAVAVIVAAFVLSGSARNPVASPVSGTSIPVVSRAEPSRTEPTQVRVYALARGGKFLADDVGGAQITLRDAKSGEFLAAGRTEGKSGSDDLMTAERTRADPVDRRDAAAFTTTLQLDAPRLVEFEVYGPLGAPGSATHVRVAQWVLPGASGANDVVVDVPGLNVQILDPPAHFLPADQPPVEIPLRVNVTMMCGCPIAPDTAWKPDQFDVQAIIDEPDGNRRTVALRFDDAAPGHAPSQFVGTYEARQSGVYRVSVTAYEKDIQNSGSSLITFVIR